MPRDTKFCADWLQSRDKNGDHISQWCKAISSDPYSASCKICCKTFSIATMGMGQLQSHSEGKKHQAAMWGRAGQMMFHVPVHTRPAADNGDSSTSQQSIVTRSKVTRSQLTLMTKHARQNYCL